MAMALSPVAMISYSWNDSSAAELLHDEFALRGFSVIHDRYSFTDGSRIPANMTSSIETCDVFVPYLTRDSLYLDQPEGEDRPALAGELLPALGRRRRNLRPGQVDRPIIIPIAHGLGDRTEASEILRQTTGEDFASLWRGEWLDQTTRHITDTEAARAADQALRSLLTRDATAAPVQLHVATRGTTPPPNKFTIDGTRLLGGERRSGTPEDWKRFRQALVSVAKRLDTHTEHAAIHIDPACHLTAALAAGRTFHQASRWSVTVSTRHGNAAPARVAESGDLEGAFDQYSETGDLLVDVDLIGHNVASLTSSLATSLQLGGRISLTRSSTVDISSNGLSRAARYVADEIRAAHASLKPQRIHITMSVPAAFSVLLGYHLTALDADIVTYEIDQGAYTPALTLPSLAP